MKILIIKPSSLGDIINTMPLIADIKIAFPQAKITWLVNKNLCSLVSIIKNIDNLIIFNRNMWKDRQNIYTFLKEFFGFLKSLRKVRYDLVLDVQGLFRSGVFTLFSKAKLKIGFDDAREGAIYAYNKKINVKSFELHAVVKNKMLLKAFSEKNLSEIKYIFQIPQENKNRLKNLLKEKEVSSRFCVLAPDARWISKKWPRGYFLQLASLITQDLGLDVVIVGDSQTEKEWEDVKLEKNCHLLAGKTSLPELVELMSKASFAVTNDSAPMQIAVALNCFVYALIGPTNPSKTGPLRNAKIIHTNLSCMPCLKKECPDSNLLNSRKCMENITVDMVYKEILKMYSYNKIKLEN